MADVAITAGAIAVTAMGGAGGGADVGAAAGALAGAWGGILFGIGHRIGTARGGWMGILRPTILIRILTRRCGVASASGGVGAGGPVGNLPDFSHLLKQPRQKASRLRQPRAVVPTHNSHNFETWTAEAAVAT